MFFKTFIDTPHGKLEEEMNQWSAENPDIKIHQMCTSESQGTEGFGVSVVIMYEKLVQVQ